MQHYAGFELAEDLNILVGIEKGKILFSHCITSEKEKMQCLQMERKYFPNLEENPTPLQPVFKKLTKYRQGDDIDPANFDIKFSRGSEFQKAVWYTLRNVGRGDVISYTELARQAKYPEAQRAVGNAMAKNYLLLFVPCHRVLKANGDLGGFGCGVDVKRMLLTLESIKQGKGQ